MFVMIVEDEAELRELTQMMLEPADIVVVTAENGERALRLLEHVRPDVVVTDMMMPVLDGFGFLEAYARRPDAAPVVAVSSFPQYLEKAKDLGASATLAKPFGPKEIIEAIRAAARAREPREPRENLPAPAVDSVADAYPQLEDGPVTEAARLRKIRDLRLDEPSPEARLRDFLAEVAAHFDVPIALVNVVDHEVTYSTASYGTDARELGKAHGSARSDWFCTHAVAARAALVVQDSARNPYFRDNPLVKERGLRFYAGVPLIARHGEAVGTLCLLDKKPRTFRHSDLELLSLFAVRVLSALEWREKRRAPDIPDSAFRYLNFYDDELGTFGSAAFKAFASVQAARAAETRQRIACVTVAVPYRRLAAVVEALSAARPGSIVGRLGHARLGWIAPGLGPAEARQLALDLAGSHAFAEAVSLNSCAGAVPSMLERASAALGDAGLA